MTRTNERDAWHIDPDEVALQVWNCGAMHSQATKLIASWLGLPVIDEADDPWTGSPLRPVPLGSAGPQGVEGRVPSADWTTWGRFSCDCDFECKRESGYLFDAAPPLQV
jgi:hypothetical protein